MRLPLVMGVLNATPDSFHSASRVDAEAAARKAADWELMGANVVDVGGESSRPGSHPVSANSELERLLPVVRAIRKATSLPISIDTTKVEVMRVCVEEGASWLNDISALDDPAMGQLAAKQGLTVILMHKKGDPLTMQEGPVYTDVVAEVLAYLSERILVAQSWGIPLENLWVDPGIGFGKNLDHNLALMRALPLLGNLGKVAVGLSRKRWIGDLDGYSDRLAGSVSGAVFAWLNGAGLVRVHDVAETLQALKVARALWTP